MARSRKPSPQTMAVLLTLAEQPAEWAHGYSLCQRLGLKAGTLYPILMRLAERGQVETRWEQDAPQGRPARHLYRLSALGVEQAAALQRAAAGSHRAAAAAAVAPAAVLGGAAS